MEEKKNEEQDCRRIPDPTKEKAFSNYKPYFASALVIFIVFCCCALVFFAIYRFDGVVRACTTLMRVMRPIIIGLVIAYLINPIVIFIDKHLWKFLKKKMKSERRAKKFSRVAATAVSLIIFILILVLLVYMMLPQLIESISGMIRNLPEQAKAFIDWYHGYRQTDNEIAIALEEVFVKGTAYLETWFETRLLPDLRLYVTSLTTGVISAVTVLFNFMIGLIIAAYVLMTKEHFVAQFKKIVYALFKPQTGNVIVETVRRSNEIFGGFISGKIIDSAIVGILCYIVLTIMKMPYTLLVSAFVGITNIIPFFGPFIGAVPSFIIIVLASPVQGFYFLIVIFILQQLDGNVIGPKILGDSTGLSSFWVVFAIMVGGGLFGVPGMILGVPTFAVIYYIVSRAVNFFLRRRGLSEDTGDYTELVSIDKKTKKMNYPNEENIEE